MNDLICGELENGAVYVWCVSIAQLERPFLRSDQYFLYMTIIILNHQVILVLLIVIHTQSMDL